MWIRRLDVVLLVVQASSFITGSGRMLGILNLEHLKILLSSSIVMLTSSPIIIKFSSNLSVSLLDVSLLNKRMLKKLWPSESLIWCLVEKTLKERFKFGRHVLGELYWVLDDEMNQSVNAIRVKWRGAFEQFIDDYSKRPQINGVVVWELLNELRSHVQGRTLD